MENELHMIYKFQLNTRIVWRGPKLLIVYKKTVCSTGGGLDYSGEGLHPARLPHTYTSSHCSTCCALFHRLWNNILIINLV